RPPTPALSTLSLHVALPILTLEPAGHHEAVAAVAPLAADDHDPGAAARRAESRERGDDRLGGSAAGVLHQCGPGDAEVGDRPLIDRKSTRLNSSHVAISYAV